MAFAFRRIEEETGVKIEGYKEMQVVKETLDQRQKDFETTIRSGQDFLKWRVERLGLQHRVDLKGTIALWVTRYTEDEMRALLKENPHINMGSANEYMRQLRPKFKKSELELERLRLERRVEQVIRYAHQNAEQRGYRFSQEEILGVLGKEIDANMALDAVKQSPFFTYHAPMDAFLFNPDGWEDNT